MSAVKTFAYRGLRVCVFADEPHLAWLEEFLAPSFCVDSGADGHCTVTIVSDDADYQGMIERGPDSSEGQVNCFILDSAIIRLPLWKSHSDENVFFDQRFNVFYCVDRNHAWVRILTRPDNLDVRFALMRVVREFAMSSSHSSDSIVVHGSAFAVGEDGFLIAGAKRAGKTSLLIHCLQKSGRRFIANDRVVVDLTGNEPVLNGMPTLVTVRDQTLDFFPCFEQTLLERDYNYRLTLDEVNQNGANGARVRSGNPFDITPRVFCALVGVEMRGSSGLRAVLFPEVTDKIEGIQIRELPQSAAAERLIASVFGAGLTHTFSDVFALSSANRHTGYESLRHLCEAMAARVQCFEVSLGRNAYASDASARDCKPEWLCNKEIPARLSVL